MKKLFLIVSCFIFSFEVSSQDLYKDFNNYYSPIKKRYEVDLDHLQRFGFQDIYSYNSNDFIKFKDSLEVFNDIKYAAIKFEENIDLDSVIINLKLIPNLKFVKFKNSFFLKKSISNNQFPKEIKNISSIETIIFDGNFDWDWNIVFNELSLLTKLKNIAFISNSDDVLITPNLLKLKHLEGLLFSSRMGPELPENLNNLTKLKTVAIYCDQYVDFNSLLTKLHPITTLKNLLLHGGVFNDTISKSFEKFYSLKNVSFYGTEFKNPELFFTSLSKNNRITEIKLSNNKLDTIPKNIKLLNSLKVFYSSNNIKAATLPNEFYSLKNLEFIEIQGSDIEIISPQINALQNLKTLNIYFNKINYLPENISGLENLQVLNIRHNRIKTLPNDVGLLKNLRELRVGDNQLNFLPEKIYLLQKLKILNLENNYLTILPINFGRLMSLQTLSIENNQLKHLPKSFSKLQSLIFLNLEANDISYLPKNFGKLKLLETLELSSNFISQLPNNFGELSNLKTLKLCHNNLKSLPNGFGNLTKLESLYINNRENYKYRFKKYDHLARGHLKDSTIRLDRKINDITKLSNDFQNLRNLKLIDLSDNTQLNNDYLFEMLKKSTFSNYDLYIRNCNISNLPIVNWNKISVKTLDVSNNKIVEIPHDIKNAPYLSSLNLSKNKKFNTTRSSKEQINLLLEEEGILDIEDMPKTIEMAIALAEVSNKKYYSKEYYKSIYYADKAIEIDSVMALKKIFDDNFIEALFKTKKYKRTIYYANEAIKKDTASNIRLLNSILPNLYYKAQSQLKIGDTLQAIESYIVLSEKFNRDFWSNSGILAKKIKQDSLAKVCFNNSFENYKKDLNNKPKGWAYHLSLLEAYIVAGENILANSYSEKLKKTAIDDHNYKVLLRYFEIILKVIENENYADFKNNFTQLKKHFTNQNVILKGWSFDLIRDWNQLNNLNTIQKENIEKLTNLFL